MSNPRTQKPGQPHLARDRQRWIYDYIFQKTGLVHHWWSDRDSVLPKSARSHDMISKHLGREAIELERLANDELDAGNTDKALKLFRDVTKAYGHAQHTIFENNEEKRFLYAGDRRCFDQVRALVDYTIEVVEIPWAGRTLTGYLHLCPGLAKAAPLMFYAPGCDTTAEVMPNPSMVKLVHELGMHLFSFDGPGLVGCSIRGIFLTPDNYEDGAMTAIDHLITRPEIDPDQVVALAGGMGSFFMVRLAAVDHRIKAVATRSSYADKYYIMDEEGPRWKQLFAYQTNAAAEEELDKTLEGLNLDGFMSRIECPILMIDGEYDHRDPIEEVYGLFDQLKAPGELWVFADQFHLLHFRGEHRDTSPHMVRWIRDRLSKKPMVNAGEVLYIEPEAEGPEGPFVSRKRRWFEPSR